jgi:hypothetical protein
MDTCGPSSVLTPQKHAFFLAILEDFMNFGFVSLLHKKNEACKFYCRTEATVERVSGFPVCTVHMDGAPELCEGHLGDHLHDHGVTLWVTTPYAHPQNGKAKQFICTLKDGMQTLIADSGLPPSFWGNAVLTMQYLHNCLPTSVLPSGTTPFEAFKNCKPDLAHLHVWGCQCFVAIFPELCMKGGP